MFVRDVEVRHGLILAPMEGVTDRVFRRLVRSIGGPGLVYTEFIPAKGLAGDHARARAMADFDDDERPLALQVFGRDPEVMAEGARVAQDLGADLVDLNMGCPSKKVCKNSGGSSLMREPDVARDIVRAMRAAVSVPFTVKMRAGWDRDSVNVEDIAWMCQEEGAEMVTVHWRTRQELYGGERDLEPIARTVDKLSIPVIANGDIVDAASARHTREATGCAGLMIGRGAIRNPWVFQEIVADLEGRPAPVVDAAEKERVLVSYFQAILDKYRSEHGALGQWKRISKYFAKGVPHGDVLKWGILHAQTVEEALANSQAYFERLRALEAGDTGAFDGVEAA